MAASIVVVLMKREQLRARAIQFGMWLATILLVSGVQWYYTVDARREGDVAVRAIERYHDNHGSYPPDIATAGLSNGRTRYKLYYRLVDGEPALGYPTTFGMFDSYDYDFAQRTWTYSPD